MALADYAPQLWRNEDAAQSSLRAGRKAVWGHNPLTEFRKNFMEKLFVINTVRPFRDGEINHTSIRYTEQGKDEYVDDMIKRFGKESIVQIAEYSLVRIIK